MYIGPSCFIVFKPPIFLLTICLIFIAIIERRVLKPSSAIVELFTVAFNSDNCFFYFGTLLLGIDIGISS